MNDKVSTGLKALVVEDSMVTQRLISIFLERVGFDVTLVDDGIDALKAIKENNFNIIFMDVMMPGVDGFSVCKVLKSNQKTKSIPVIMLTSRDGMFDKVKGKMAGADIYLTKPIKHADLLEAVSKFLPISRGELGVSYNKTPQPAKAPVAKPVAEKPAAQPSLGQKAANQKKVVSIAERLRQARKASYD